MSEYEVRCTPWEHGIMVYIYDTKRGLLGVTNTFEEWDAEAALVMANEWLTSFYDLVDGAALKISLSLLPPKEES